MNYYWETDSPVGKLSMLSDGESLLALWFTDQERKSADFLKLEGEIKTERIPLFEKTENWLERYFRKENPAVDLPIRLIGTEFQKKVWNLISEIPYGKTASYKDLARQISDTMSCQAVGQAVRRNPVSILIGCHRIIGSDGSLTGYAGGLDRKVFLLALEKQDEKN